MDVQGFDKNLRYRYQPQGGFPVEDRIPVSLARTPGGAALPVAGANVVGFGAIATNLYGLIWDAAANTSQVATIPWALPTAYQRDNGFSGDRSKIVLRVRARKIDTGSNPENATLALAPTIGWHSPIFSTTGNQTETDGDSASSTITLTTQLLNSKVADATASAFRFYEFDVTGTMTSAQRLALREASTIVINLGLSAQPGTGLAVHVDQVRLWYPGLATFPRMVDREKTFTT